MSLIIKPLIRLKLHISLYAILFSVLTVSGCATLGGSTQYAVLKAKNSVAPALVHIRPLKEVFAAGRRSEVPTVGSGFIISSDGYIVTNEHVAGESSQVWCVFSDNTELEAKVVGTDADTDVAVLKVDTEKKLPYVKMGRSSDLEAGQLVLAMGSPHGLARSVSLGIISVTDRYLGDNSGMVSPYNNWIQTDAAINPGNSGGPLVNIRGEVIGVNARVLSGAENVGFAIPIDIAREVVDAIIREGTMCRSYLGLTFQEMSAKTDDPNLHGVVIADVAPLSPAQEAGIKPGDLLIGVNDIEVDARFEEDLPKVRKIVADLPIGEQVSLKILRGDSPMQMKMITEEKVSVKGGQSEFPEWGFTAVELTPELARRAQLAGRSGALISGSQPGSIAAISGLSQGDIILSIDGETVASLDGFTQAYQKRLESKQKLVMLFVQRGAVTRFVLLNTGTKQDTTLDKDLLEHAN